MAELVIADASTLIALARVNGLAKKKGLIPSARAMFGQLHASDFRIAPAVIQAVLTRCDEG